MATARDEPFLAARCGPLDDGHQCEAATAAVRPALAKVLADSLHSPRNYDRVRKNRTELTGPRKEFARARGLCS
jgi:hypothetical protein